MSHILVVQQKRQWPAIRFATPRRPLRSFNCDQLAYCPLTIEDPQRCFSVSLGFGVRVRRVIAVAVTNRSATAVHSFALRFLRSHAPHSSGIGVQPERLLPGASHWSQLHDPEEGCSGACVDFVQFTTGDVWSGQDRDALVTDAGLAAGSAAAVEFLQHTMARLGAEAIIAALPRIHADVVAPTRAPTFGPFGYYAGVTRVAVGLQSAFKRERLGGVVSWLSAPPFCS